MSLFDNILGMIEETDREVLKKNPKVADKINELDGFVSSWENWRKANWDDEHKMTKNALEALQMKDQEIEALRLLQGGDVDWDSIKSNVQSLIDGGLATKKVMTRDDFEKEILPKLPVAKADDITKLNEKFTNLERGMEFTYAKTAHLPFEYYKEFSGLSEAPKFTMESFFKYMTDNKISDIDQAYEKMVSPLRIKLNEQAIAKREEEIKKATREETLKEFNLSKDAMPVDASGTSPESSALQMRIANRKKTDTEGAPKLTPGTLGDGSASTDAYQNWLRDKAAGKTLVQ